jgi:valyl-tRNA synthetase
MATKEEAKDKKEDIFFNDLNISKLLSPYDPSKVEKVIYESWEKSGYFNPDNLPTENILKDENGKEKTYTVILPPPNVTGTLHCGHALMLAVQDAIIRYKRMNGYKTLWLPGTDHAAISTQSVVEKKIYKEEGKNRHEIGREEMMKRINVFALESQNTIISQFKSMGSSLDWSRLAFTLDNMRNAAVSQIFKNMYEDGLIYKGHRIVNWDPKGQTTISDDETNYIEEKSKFYYFKYGPFIIGTARPETKFGDKYVVIHPDDERYSEYKHGDKIKVEWINGELEATIIKDEASDPNFGSGVMTITPWHSQVDFELAQKYDLDYEQIIDKYGKLLPVAGQEFMGLKIKEARDRVVDKLASRGLLVDKNGNKINIDQIEDYTHNVQVAERTGGIIEPQIMNQWFVAVNKEFDHASGKTTLKKLMHDCVENGETKITPERFDKVYHHWINNLKDWCISRQIWYGHRVPVWYNKEGNIVSVGTSPVENSEYTQDEDTLDTWFSSGMWTFSTLGWPQTTKDLDNYHPTQLLETGYDILFFWVARMIMMTKYALNQTPFENVYLHGLVLDAKGKKMSKSIGNVLDPRDMSDKYGTDALRMGLLVANGPGNDLRLDENKIKAYKLFANKIWNATRFTLEKCNDFDLENLHKVILTSIDQDIVNNWKSVKLEISNDIEEYRLHVASEKLYNYFWKTYCDVIIESHKLRIINPINQEDKRSAQATLLILLRDNIKTLHPFMPFITEELWSLIKMKEEDILMITKWDN